MEHLDKVKTISFLRPNAKFTLRGDELEWLDETQTEPTKKEIESGWLAYQAAEIAEAEAKAAAKASLLEKLGISEAEAKLLLN